MTAARAFPRPHTIYIYQHMNTSFLFVRLVLNNLALLGVIDIGVSRFLPSGLEFAMGLLVFSVLGCLLAPLGAVIDLRRFARSAAQKLPEDQS